ncbi:MAG: glycoside hydrolase, partial [Candidatus Omnitrophica bacterium CG11_big_fil_rev_8_21_14_0_20_63_9]
EDARSHLQQAVARHQQAFGTPPAGLWPSEGSVSEEAVQLIAECGLRWIATDEEILWRTLRTGRSASLLYRPHLVRCPAGQVAMVFRDRELSDLIGFTYSQWEPAVAVNDFVNRLARIHDQFRSASVPGLVSIILDGENAWESYPGDGQAFFQHLYEALARDVRFRCVTVSEFLQQHPPSPTESLPTLFSGSWIDGNFSTWVGHVEKNRAWDYLAEAREALASVNRQDADGACAWKHLEIAEGSDWMWWFGDTHYTAQADEFDRLFRIHLTNAYTRAGLQPPAALASPIRYRPAPQLHEPTGRITPTIDGRETSYYEWLYAGLVDLTQQYAAIHRGDQCLRKLWYGFDGRQQYVRIDLDAGKLPVDEAWAIELDVGKEQRVSIVPKQRQVKATLVSSKPPIALECAMDRFVELVLPNEQLGLAPGQHLQLALSLKGPAGVLERYPAQGTFNLIAFPADLDVQVWPI